MILQICDNNDYWMPSKFKKNMINILGTKGIIKKWCKGPNIGSPKCRTATPEGENQKSTEKTHSSRKCTVFEAERKYRSYYEWGMCYIFLAFEHLLVHNSWKLRIKKSFWISGRWFRCKQ